MMESIKRARSGNWSQEEKETLLMLIKERIDIIENKSCDGIMIARKQQMWKQVKTLFEAEHGETRDLQRLKEQWSRMKLSKECVNMLKKYQRGTGGGGALPENRKINPPTELDYKVMSLISGQLEKDSSIYDDDAELGMLEVVPDTTGTVVQEEGPTIEELSTSKLMDEELQKEIDTPQRRQKRNYKEMSAYEEAMLVLQKEKIAKQREEVKRRREMEEEQHKKELAIKTEELEIKRLEKLFWQKKIENLNK